MAAHNRTKPDIAEELARVKRHIDQAVMELADARARMTSLPGEIETSLPGPREAEMATLCISLELALADSVAWAQRLAEKVRSTRKPAAMSPA